MALGLRQSAGGEVGTDFIRLFDTDSSHRLDFSDVGWDAEIGPAGTFVGVIDMGTFLDEMQSGSVNVQINDDTGLDWAYYIVTVATPIADPLGPTVLLDGGGSATIDSLITGIHELQVGGAAAGELRIEPAGRIDIGNDYVQLANGSLALELGAGSLTGVLVDVADVAQLAGTLSVELAPGYTPVIGAEFDILSALSVADEFDDVDLPSLPSNMAWELTYNPTGVLLTIVENALPGDYNGDGTVDTADYVTWRKNGGTPAEYDTWRAHFGQTAGSGAHDGSGSQGAVPEPGTLLVFLIGLAVLTICCPFRTVIQAKLMIETQKIVSRRGAEIAANSGGTHSQAQCRVKNPI
jgi:hypothetical protein